jgi:hypothetical protein
MLYIRGERCCDGLDGNMAMGLLARKVPPRAEGRKRWVRYGYIPSFEWMLPSIHARPLFHGCCLVYARLNVLHSCNPSVGSLRFLQYVAKILELVLGSKDKHWILPHASMVPYVLPNVALILVLMLGSKDMHWIPTHAQTE